MRKTSMLAYALAGVAFSTTSVSAANLPVKAPVRTPVAAVAYSWSGFYFGAHVGYGFADVDTDTTHLPTQAGFDADPFSHGTSVKGLLGGLQAGYNMQSGGLVYGFEVDFSYSDVSGDSRFAPLPLFGGAPDPGSSQAISAKLNWLSTARLRLGTNLADRTLVYVTGGAAYGRVKYGVVTDYVGDPFRYPGSASKTKLGWTAGAGIEMAMSEGWSVKAEYLYFDLGGNTIVANPVALNPPFQVSTAYDMQGHIVRLGVNYRFGGATTVAARY